MITAIQNNALSIVKKILSSESIASGSGTVDFSRMNLDISEWEAYELENSLDCGDKNLYVYSNNLEQRDEIVNEIKVTSNNMDAGSQIIINCYTTNNGLIGTITETLAAVTAGNNLIVRTNNQLLFDADYFKIEYNFIKGASAYIVDVDLMVKAQSAAVNTALKVWDRNTEVSNLVTEQDLTDAYLATDEIDAAGYTHIAVESIIDINTSVTPTMIAKGSFSSGGDYQDIIGSEVVNLPVADGANISIIETKGIPYIQPYIKHISASGTVGDVTINIVKAWSV